MKEVEGQVHIEGLLTYILLENDTPYMKGASMPETNFRPSSTVDDIGKLRIEAERITGQGGPVFPQLNVPVQISLTSAEVQYRMSNVLPTAEDPIQDYSLLQIYGTLFFGSQTSGMVQIADFHSLPISHFSRTSGPMNIVITIPLDAYRLQQIEERRVGDVSLKFTFSFLLAQHFQARRKETNPPVEKFDTSWVELTVPVSQSHWVNNVLPGLGYGKTYLVEVPIAETALGESLAKAVAEFRQGQTYMNRGDYNKVLGHCRNALELFSNARTYEGEKKNPSFADKIDYLLDVLPGAPTGVRRTNLARMLKDLHGLTSIPQHPSPPHFSRDDAEMTIVITTALLSYLGKLLS